MVKQIKRGGGRMKTAYWSLVGMASAMLISLQPCHGGHNLEPIFDDHEGCIRPAGGYQHHCGGNSSGHCADCQDDFQKPARSR